MKFGALFSFLCFILHTPLQSMEHHPKSCCDCLLNAWHSLTKPATTNDYLTEELQGGPAAVTPLSRDSTSIKAAPDTETVKPRDLTHEQKVLMQQCVAQWQAAQEEHARLATLRKQLFPGLLSMMQSKKAGFDTCDVSEPQKRK